MSECEVGEGRQDSQETVVASQGGVSEAEEDNYSELPENPWLRLDKFVSYRKTEGSNYIFYCKVWLPKQHKVRTQQQHSIGATSRRSILYYTEDEEAYKAALNYGKKRLSLA